MSLLERVQTQIAASLQTVWDLSEHLPAAIEAAAVRLASCLLGDGKILCCGNGGSAALAQMFSCAMLNRFDRERPGLPAMALTADLFTLTSIANDLTFDDVFAKQIRALGHPGDVLLVYTRTGNSPNILAAVIAAHDREMGVLALTGGDGGAVVSLLGESDLELRVPSETVARIHEAHLLITHCLCDLVDQQLFG